MSDYESVVLVKSEVFVYKIPPLGTSRGYKAADWKLDTPDWTGRLRLISKSNKLEIKLEDKSSGELFAKCPIDKYPGTSVESVTDSSRYFVLRLVDDSGRNALIGMGFADRGDSFDLNVALQDHFKYLEKDAKLTQEMSQESSKPKLDLGFKAGETITINIGGGSGKKGGNATSRPKPSGVATAVPLLPPPPGPGARLPPPAPGANNLSARSSPSTVNSGLFETGNISPLSFRQSPMQNDLPVTATNPFLQSNAPTVVSKSNDDPMVGNLL